MEPKGLLTISSITTCLTSPQGFFFSLKRRLCVCVFLYVHSVLVFLCLTGIPDCSEEELSVARALNLRWRTVLKSDEDGTQTLINSEEVVTVDDDQ